MEIQEGIEEKPHDLNELLNLIIEKTKKFTHSERVIIYLYDEHEQILWNRAGEGVEFMSVEFKLGQGIPGQVIEKEKTFVINDTQRDSRYDPKIDDITDVRVKSMLCAPITEKNKKIGVIQLINKQDGEYDDDDVAFVEAMAAQASIAIENTVLFGSLQETRKHEQELAEKIKEQNDKLQEAYMKVEEEKKTVQESSKNVTRNRIIGTIGAILLFVLIGLGIWAWTYRGKGKKQAAAPTAEQLGIDVNKIENKNVFTVTPQSLSYPLTLRGILEPASIENKFAPFTGRIVSKNFTIGEEVAKGQVLMVINDEKVQVEYRNAKVAEITAKEEFDKKKDWASSTQLADAKRDVFRAQEKLDSSQKLYDLGVISKEQLDSADDALHSAKTKLETTEKEGDAKAVQVAKFKWENAAVTEKEFAEKMKQAVIKSDTIGVAILPPSGTGGGGVEDKKTKPIEVGMTIDDGTVFVSIADLTRLKVVGKVEEVDITSVKQGQEVKVTGDAFPGITLEGKVTYVSSQAKQGGRAPYFEINVETEELTEEQRKRIRLGMSATLSIVTYSNPEALMVPFAAIKIARDGNYVYKIVEGQAQPESVRVETGKTTPTSVEITSGVQAGDQLLILNP
ncbi:MAG: hypothetical protein C5B43_05130 [Verrucomicrobia bacterium]|nr:MAG: hypothetical protein C5B43_05130 [Verrucomicrobiota bacterium]